MTSREVRVHEIKEVLWLWLRGEGLRSIKRLSGRRRGELSVRTVHETVHRRPA